MNKQSGFNAEQINKDKNPESKNRLKIKSKIMSYHNKTTTVRLLNQQVITREDNISLQYPAVCMRRHRRAVTHTTECPAR